MIENDDKPLYDHQPLGLHEVRTFRKGAFRVDMLDELEKPHRKMFIGHGTLRNGMQTLPYTFPINAANISEAFEGFEKAAKAYGKLYAEELNRPRIATPSLIRK